MDGKAKKPIYKKWWVWLIAAALLGAIINMGEEEEIPEAEATADIPKPEIPILDKVIEKVSPQKEIDTAKEKPKETPKEEPKEEIQITSAYNLHTEYMDNEIAADKKYKGKQLEVTGNIKNIGKDVLGRLYITLETGDIFSTIQVFFKSSEEDAIAELTKGQEVTIIGRGDGLSLTSVFIKNAEVK